MASTLQCNFLPCPPISSQGNISKNNNSLEQWYLFLFTLQRMRQVAECLYLNLASYSWYRTAQETIGFYGNIFRLIHHWRPSIFDPS
jgi:hypothetical protein